MPTYLTPHFTLEELGGGLAPPAVRAKLVYTAERLEPFRQIMGAPFIVTSGYRTVEHNAEIGGSTTSDHPNGLAADGYFSGLNLWQVYDRLKKNRRGGGLPPFDQIIFYPQTTGHIHFGFGPRMRGNIGAYLKSGLYVDVTSEIEQLFPGYGNNPAGVGGSANPTPTAAPKEPGRDYSPWLIGAAILAALGAAYFSTR